MLRYQIQFCPLVKVYNIQKLYINKSVNMFGLLTDGGT